MDKSCRLREQDRERLQALCIFDDDFLGLVFEDNFEGTELLLNIVLGREDMKVVKITRQREIKGLEGHSVRLDIAAEDADHQVYDIEIQKYEAGNLPLRARYYSSMLDTTLLHRQEDYSQLVPTYVIFFTEKDTIGDGLPLHHYVMKDMDTNTLLGDERHVMLVNGSNRDESTALGKLIHDFQCTAASDMYYESLAKRVRYFKETEGGANHMSGIFEEIRREAATEAATKAGIMAAIEAGRRFHQPEADIKKLIMEMYDLDEKTADEYLLKKGA